MPVTQQPGRKPTQQRELVADLRRRIAAGHLRPGTELPSQLELVKHYGISGQTAQRALNRLVQQGFIRAEPRRGRYVAPHPPCHHRFALVFSGHCEPIRSYHWTRLFAAQLAAARQFDARGPVQWAPYFDAGPEDPIAQRRTHEQLTRDIAEHRLAGLFLTAPPETLGLTQLAKQAPLPMVVWGGVASERWATIKASRTDFLRRTIDHLTGRDRRRIAWLTHTKESVDTVLQEVQRACRFGDVTIQRDWIVAADPYRPDWLAHALSVLMDRPGDQRPDGLVVADDHLVEPAAEALMTMDIDTPNDLTVVAQWNWPLAYTSAASIHLLGYDGREHLELAARLLRGNARGTQTVSVWGWEQFCQRGGKTVALSSVHAESPSVEVSIERG